MLTRIPWNQLTPDQSAGTNRSGAFQAWKAWSAARAAGRRRKKRKKKKLPKTSSHSSSGCARLRQRQWHARFAGFPGDVPLRALRSSSGLRCSATWPVWTRSIFRSSTLEVAGMCKVGLAGFAVCDTPRAVFPSFVNVRGDSTGAVLGQGDMPVVVPSGAFCQTAQKPVDFLQLPFIAGRRHPGHGAEADSHGLECSADHGDSATQYFLGGRCPCCAIETWSPNSIVQKTDLFPQVQFLGKIVAPVLCNGRCVVRWCCKLWLLAVAVHRRSSTSFSCRRVRS